MSVNVKKDETTGEYYIDINDLSEYFDDISKLSYYTIAELENGVLQIEFFEEDDKKVIPKSRK